MFSMQLLGGILVGVGLYAFFEKWKGTGYSLVLNAEQIILDIVIGLFYVQRSMKANLCYSFQSSPSSCS